MKFLIFFKCERPKEIYCPYHANKFENLLKTRTESTICMILRQFPNNYLRKLTKFYKFTTLVTDSIQMVSTEVLTVFFNFPPGTTTFYNSAWCTNHVPPPVWPCILSWPNLCRKLKVVEDTKRKQITSPRFLMFFC